MATLAIVMLVSATGAARAQGEPGPGPLRLGDDARIDARDFRVTTFAAGLPYPTGMAELPDGSLVVAVNLVSEGGLINARAKLLRLADLDGDGVADEIKPIGIVSRKNEASPLVFTDLPNAVVQMRRFGDLLFISTRERHRSGIIVLRGATDVGNPLEIAGQLDLAFPAPYLHGTYALALRKGSEPDSVELYFNIGSRLNSASDDTPIVVSGLVDAALRSESVYRMTLADDGSTIVVTDVTQVASGLRNAAALAFRPSSGDLYIGDNGIDRPDDPAEPLSADEINVIDAERLGETVVDFGFPYTYVEYRTGTLVGTGGEQPLVAVQPIEGSEAEGAAAMTFAPPRFPRELSNGLFVGFHGRWSLAGLENEENPLLFIDPDSGSSFEFVPNDLPGVGHLDNVLVTEDSLFIADLNSKGTLWTPESDGVIYQVQASSRLPDAS